MLQVVLHRLLYFAFEVSDALFLSVRQIAGGARVLHFASLVNNSFFVVWHIGSFRLLITANCQNYARGGVKLVAQWVCLAS